jgi:RNA polymerase sigma-70 factor (ECF subfamily)
MDVSDEELIERYRSASTKSAAHTFVDQLFQRHHSRVAAWCYRITNDVETASDLAQDIFLKAFQRLDSFRGESKFTTWLYTIARNHCMDALRSRATAVDQDSEPVFDQMEDLRLEDIADVLERSQSAELARELMKESLDEVEIQVMTLHYVHELPLDQVTRMLDLKNLSGAKAYIVSARRKLARAVELWRNREQNMRGGSRAQ